MKKIICLMLTLVMALSVAGCKGEKKAVSNEDGIISFTMMGNPNHPTDKDTETEKWIEEKYGVSIDVYSVTASYYEKLATMLASDEVPDVMFINEPQNWQPLVDQGFLAQVTKEQIKKYAPRHFAAINEKDERIWAISSYKGENWVLPKLMGDEYGTVTVWRKDWLDKLGITKIPETLEEFEAAYLKVRNEDPDGNGQKDTYGFTGCGGATERQFDQIFGAFGVMPGQWIVENGKVSNGTVDDRAKEALTLLHKWYEMEIIDPEMITDTQQTYFPKFNANRVAVINTGYENMIETTATGAANKKNFEEAHPGVKWEDAVAFGSLPQGKDGTRGDWLWGPRANFVVFGEQLSDNEEKLGKILSILDDINYNEENAIRAVWGEKGVTYDYIDPEVGVASGLKFLAPYDTDTTARSSKGLNGFFNILTPAYGWASADIVRQYTDASVFETKAKLTEDTKYVDSLMRPYLASAKRYQADLDKLKTTAYSEFITGARDLETWDDFVKEYMAKGGEQLQKEAQEFYDTNMK